MNDCPVNLIHPYPRYGLAVALLKAKATLEEMTEAEFSEILAQALETGLEHFRMETQDDPNQVERLRYDAIHLQQLRQDNRLVQSAGLAASGKYLYPTVVTTDGDAKGTYENAEALIKALRSGRALNSDVTFKRSFAPTTAKINNGKPSQTEPRGTLVEAACATITTLTAIKPAAWVAMRNTVIIPDLTTIEELRDFVELFERMMHDELDDLMQASLAQKKTTPNDAKPTKRTTRASTSPPKSLYKRPRIFQGNYPFAPRDAAAFGAVGLLGAIGRWSRKAKMVPWARRVLESIEGLPLYIISYDGVSQVQFGNHVTRLSIEGRLSEMLDALIYETQLYSETDNPRRVWDAPQHKLFHLVTSRFLQLFTLPAFRDFLATRAEYPQEVEPLFKEYFMKSQKINQEIVSSARIFGQWLNRTAYFVADDDVKKDKPDREKEVRKAKAKILVEFESAAMGAKSPQDMLYRISTRAGRLLQSDAPVKATRFLDAVNSGEIEAEDGMHLLVTYMRLRTQGPQKGHPAEGLEITESPRAVDPYNQ